VKCLSFLVQGQLTGADWRWRNATHNR